MGEHSTKKISLWVRIHCENIICENSLGNYYAWVRIHYENIVGEHSP